MNLILLAQALCRLPCCKKFMKRKFNFTKEQIIEMGTYISYHGNDKCANELMTLCINKNDSITAGNWHAYSVQNTKNGNYSESIQALEKSLSINVSEMEGYYGWVLLYYFRDYEKSLKHFSATGRSGIGRSTGAINVGRLARADPSVSGQRSVGQSAAGHR